MFYAVAKQHAVGDLCQRVVERLMGQLLFKLFSFADVHHRPQHADRFAVGVMDNIAAVDNKRISVVRAPEPVFVRPIVLAAFDMPRKSVTTRSIVVRMKAPLPRVDVGADLLAE